MNLKGTVSGFFGILTKSEAVSFETVSLSLLTPNHNVVFVDLGQTCSISICRIVNYMNGYFRLRS